MSSPTASSSEAAPAQAPRKLPQLWGNRDYMLLWSGQAVSALGTQVSTIAFPFLVLIIVILAILGPGIQNMYIAVFAAGWTIYARLARAEMLVIREQEYILAARALGYGRLRIIFRHALPNLIQSSIVFSMSDFILNILLASSLSYFGIGVQPPAPEWGAIINDGRDYLLQAWWISTLPGIAVIVTGVAVSLIGDGAGKILGQRNG